MNDKADLEFYNKSGGRNVEFSFKQINSVQFALSASFITLQDYGDAVVVSFILTNMFLPIYLKSKGIFVCNKYVLRSTQKSINCRETFTN